MGVDEDEDAALVRAVAAGDQDALHELYRRHAGWLLLRLQRRCGDGDVVAATLQDTFLSLWNGASRWRAEGEVGAYLWGIAVRRLVSHLRARPAPAASADALTSRGGAIVRSAEDELLAGVEHGDVGWALRTLSPELQATIQAVVIDGLSTREAAGLLGIPHGTVKSRMRRARSQLQVRLMPTGERRLT